MKKIFIALTIALLCVSCDTKNPSATDSGYDENQFEVVSAETFDDVANNSYRVYIIVHKETGVMYMYTTGFYKAGLTVMLNPNGTPCIYKGK